MPEREPVGDANGGLVDAVAVALVLLDSQLRITRVNDAFTAWTGFARSDLIGCGPRYPFWPDGEEPADLERRMRAADDGTPRPREVTLCHQDGRALEAMMARSPLPRPDGDVAGYVVTFWDLSAALSRQRLERALGDVALIAAGARDDSRPVLDAVAARVGGFLDVAWVAVVRFEGDRGVVVGAHARPSVPSPDSFSVSDGSAVAGVARTGGPSRVEYVDADSGFAGRSRAAGLVGAVAVPIELEGALWGCLGVAFDRARRPGRELERLLARFAALVSLALGNADAWSRLQRHATTDGLTGVLNHRSFYERLEAEQARAVRYARPLALVLCDVDGLKALNDGRGHQAGDRALHTVARAFVAEARAADVVARVGGDEFAVIAPDTDAAAALALADRLRAAAVAALAEVGLAVSVSCGVCDLTLAEGVDELVRLADGALYLAKRQGGNQAAIHTPGVGDDLSRELALTARVPTAAEALSRAVATKAGSARDHPERVARIAEHVAARLGWDHHRRVRLRQAALLHDVGKLAVPQAILTKPGRLTSAEYEQVKPHAAHGVHLAEGLLDPEQLTWIRWHHERLDGSGYPDGLGGEDIPEEARVLAVADAYDAITSGLSYSTPKTPAQAVDELRRCARSQFDPAVVDSVTAWVAASRKGQGKRARQRQVNR